MFSWRVCLCRFLSFRFKAKGNLERCGMSSLTFWLQAGELRVSVCFNIFENFNRSLKETYFFCTNNNWINGREMFRQTSAKQANTQTQVRQQNKQMVECAGRRWMQPMNLARICIHSVKLSVISQTEYERRCQNWSYSSHSLEYAEWVAISHCSFVTFCKQ